MRALFSPPTHCTHTHTQVGFAKDVHGGIYIGLIGMLTYSLTAKPQLAQWERPAVGPDMKLDGRGNKRLPVAAEHHQVGVQ